MVGVFRTLLVHDCFAYFESLCGVDAGSVQCTAGIDVRPGGKCEAIRIL